jgi:hypothetical protein
LENEVCASASCEQGNLFSYFIWQNPNIKKAEIK